MAIVFRSFGFLVPKMFYLIWFSNILVLRVPDEGYSRNKRVARDKFDIYDFITAEKDDNKAKYM
jgi:hypothetical protein